MGVRLPPPSPPRRSCAGDDGRLQRTPIERLIGRLNRNPIFLRILNLRFKYGYRFLSRLLTKDDVLFLNYGYEEDPPMDLPLAASDESDRFAIQLYHRTATQVDLAGKKVLEVSCGHGGGASYLTRTQRPSSYTGLDLNNLVGIEFCRKRYNLHGLDFVQGNAESLPFPDQSFDAVINVEAAINYRNVPGFFTEVEACSAPGRGFPVRRYPLRRRNRGLGDTGCQHPHAAGFGTGHQCGGHARAGEKSVFRPAHSSSSEYRVCAPHSE